MGGYFRVLSTGWIHGFSRRGPPCPDHHVGQTKERAELMPVLRQPSMPHLPAPEDVLQDVEGMFHERPHAGLGLLTRLLCALGQRFDLAAPAQHLPELIRGLPGTAGKRRKKLATLPVGEWNQIFGWLRGVGLLQVGQLAYPPSGNTACIGGIRPKVQRLTQQMRHSGGRFTPIAASRPLPTGNGTTS